ncbi:MAG: protein kinase [Gemmataceae bacterium]|nr:protein kinase [Gemmataceae bacterium]
MASPALDAFVDALRRKGLLDPRQLEAIGSALKKRHSEPRDLAQALLKKGWLTAYQINQLLQGHGDDLILGQYVLLERLGEGGMGQVFKARHRGLKRDVALKVIRKDRLGNAEAVRRFQREIHVAAQLSHPNVVAGLDADQIGDTHLFVMEHVEGADLGKIVKERGRIPVGQACDYIRQAALGLQHAHEKSMVHRDIKPSNLLLSDQGGLVKVLDLGLSRLHQPLSDKTIDATLTQSGSVFGTPDYMSPEQARDAHTVDIRGDIYSLGCTLYHLLAGQVPFPGGTAMEKVFKQQLDEPEPIERVCPEVPRGLAAVLRKMMAKKPEDRFETPADVAKALEPFAEPISDSGAVALGNDPRSASTDTARKAGRTSRTIGDTGARRPRNRARVLVPLCIAVLLLGGGLLAFQFGRSGDDGPKSTAGNGVVQGPTSELRTDKGPATWPMTGKKDPLPTRKEIVPKKEWPPPDLGMGFPKELVSTIGEPRWRQWGPIQAVAVNMDGTRVASAGVDSIVRVWDAMAGVETARMRGHSRSVGALAFSPDGKTLASGSLDGTAILWDAATGKMRTAIECRPEVRAIAYSPNGKLLACGGAEYGVKLFDAQTGESRGTLKEGGTIYSLAFTHDGKHLAVAGIDGKRRSAIKLFDLATQQPQTIAQFEGSSSVLVAASPNDALIAYGHSTPAGANVNMVARVHDLETRKDRINIQLDEALQALRFSSDGQSIALASPGVMRLQPIQGKETRTFRVDSLPAPWTSVAFFPDGKSFVSGHSDHVIRLWDTTTGARSVPAPGQAGGLTQLAYSPDGRMLAAWGLRTQDKVRVWNTGETQKEFLLGDAPSEITRLGFGAASQTLAAVGPMGGGIWNTESKTRKLVIDDDSHGMRSALSPDGRFLAVAGGLKQNFKLYDAVTAEERPLQVPGKYFPATIAMARNVMATSSFDAGIHVWDLAKGEVKAILPKKSSAALLTDISSDGTLVASMHSVGKDGSGEVRLWSVADKTELRSFKLALIQSPALQFTPDGTWLVVRNRQGLRMHEVATGKEWESSARSQVLSFAISSDSKTLAVVEADGQFSLWEVAVRSRLWQWTAPGPIGAVAFHPTGRTVATANANGTIYVFKVRAGPGLERPEKLERLEKLQ